jgi:hypothetical protein
LFILLYLRDKADVPCLSLAEIGRLQKQPCAAKVASPRHHVNLNFRKPFPPNPRG